MSPEIDNTQPRLDVHTRSTRHTGLSGVFEIALRRFRSLLVGAMLLPFYGLASICVGAALLPSFYFFGWVRHLSTPWPEPIRYFAIGTAIGACFFISGFSLLFILPLVNFVTRSNLKPWRGPYYSLESVRWYIHNGAVYLIRYSFLEFVTPTPFSGWFYRMMGMKIGPGTLINTTHISDPSLIELGKHVTIGGSATIVAHYGQGGVLVLAPVKIGDGATIGLKATIMGGVTIGKGAKIMANSVVLPNTTVPDGETWGGVPAKKISLLKREA